MNRSRPTVFCLPKAIVVEQIFMFQFMREIDLQVLKIRKGCALPGLYPLRLFGWEELKLSADSFLQLSITRQNYRLLGHE